MLHEHAQAKPNEIALDDLRQQRTWAELADRVNRIARHLREGEGLAAGDHAAILMHDRVESIELLWGAIYAGLWVTPINWHLTPREIDYIPTDSGAKILFTEAGYEEVAARSGCRAVLRVGDELEGALAGAASSTSVACITAIWCPPCSCGCSGSLRRRGRLSTAPLFRSCCTARRRFHGR